MKFLDKHSPTLLTILGVIGIGLTSYFVAKGTEKKIADHEYLEFESKVDEVKSSAKHYVPAIITGALTITCVVTANVLNKKREASILAAYGLVHGAFKKYKRHAEFLYGPEVHDNVAGSIINEQGVPEESSQTNDVLFFDELYNEKGGYFTTTKEKLYVAMLALNREYVSTGNVSLAYFYEKLGLEFTDTHKNMWWVLDDNDYDFWIDVVQSNIQIEDGDSMLDVVYISYNDYPIADSLITSR